jgi:hypothetical protein
MESTGSIVARATADFKRKMLALLKEDEEFRYAVVGLLGIEDLRGGQARLEEGQARGTTTPYLLKRGRVQQATSSPSTPKHTCLDASS